MKKIRSRLTSALGFGLLSFAIFKITLTKLRERAQREPKAETANTENDQRDNAPPQTAALPVNQLADSDTETQDTKCTDNHTGDKHNEAGINWLAVQTIATIFFGLATIVVLVYHGVIFIKQQEATQGQLDAAKAQLAVAQKQFESTDRPWLSVDAVSERPLLFRSLGAGITVKFTVKNVGRSVANNAKAIADVFIGKSGEDVYGKAIERQKQICEETTTTITSHAVFPGDTFTDGQLIIVGMPEMERGRNPDSNDVPFFLIIGCVTYQFGDQPTRHHTYFIYDIVGPGRHPIQIGQDVPAGGLTFFKSSNGGDDAD